MSPGFLLIISAPSGAGKSTVCRKLRERDRSLRYSISCSTRKRRPSEKHGVHYFFLSVPEFRKSARGGEFLEWAEVHENFYGTPKRFIDKEVGAGNVVLLDIDVKGAAQIRSKRRKDIVTIFLLPPSWTALQKRLRLRRDTNDTMQTRLANARHEMSHANRYDYWVVNDSLSTAVSQVEAIITAERQRSSRISDRGSRLKGLVSRLGRDNK